MTTEGDFQSALDADPSDWQTRLVFADWLDERGDPRAGGYRALGVLRKSPYPWLGGHSYHNGRGRLAQGGRVPRMHALPIEWVDAIAGKSATWAHAWGRELTTRREAEDAAAIAFAAVPVSIRHRLLSSRRAAGNRRGRVSR